jgi:membrane-associated phospholipid phosphatase
MAIAAIAFAFPARVDGWPLLLVAHLIVIAVFWPLPLFGRMVGALGEYARHRVRSVLDWTPLLLIPLLYTELAVLNRSVHGGRYFDDLIIAVEQKLLGGMPSDAWADAAPFLWLSEPLHAAYLSYYIIIFTPPLILFVRKRTEDFRRCVFTVMLAFFAHYVFFIFFPVQGPRYLYAPPGGHLATGYFYGVAHKLLEAGSAQGSAFPSSHVGVSVAQSLITLRLLPRFGIVAAILTAGLAFGAIYGGFHYATDALAGALLGTIVFLVSGQLYGRIGSAA